MIPRGLQDYVKIYTDIIDPALCKETVSQLDSVRWERHCFYQAGSDSYVSYENELSVSNENIPARDLITKKLWNVLEQYILKDFSSFEPWFNGWTGYSPVRFNRYDPTTQMKLHCDHIQTLFDGERKGVPILTMLGTLNDDYEGGEFLMFGDEEIIIPVGGVLVFPSTFMYPHEVRLVTSGVRYSYVSWSW